MANKKKETGVVAIGDQFTALASVDNLKEVVLANFGTRAATWTDLERIRVGAGGVLTYQVEDEIDGVSGVDEFEALICWWKDQRVWWKTPIGTKGAENGPPNCVSNDLVLGAGVNGFAEPGVPISCDTCPNNRFGKNPAPAIEDNWCKDTRMLFLLRPEKKDAIFPSVLIVPPGSLKPVQKYLMALTSRGLPYFATVHKFTLTGDVSQGGFKYSKVKIDFVRKLEADEVKLVQGFAHAVQPAFETLVPEQDAVE